MGDKNSPFHSIFNNPLLFRSIRVILDGGQRRYIKNILERYYIKSIIDIGCGTGEFSDLGDFDYLGIDYNEKFVHFCQEKYPNKKFLLEDALRFHVQNKYDAAILINSLHHFDNFEAIQVLRNMKRASQRYMIIHDVVPCKNPISRLFYSLDRGAFIRSIDNQQDLLRKAGLLPSAIHYMVTFPGIYRHSTIICNNGN